jgi:PAS domain S-box-containing protein
MSSMAGGPTAARHLAARSKGSVGFLADAGEMGERTRTLDWANTAVGPIDAWPASLKSAVSICLGSRHPMVVWWGRSAYTQFYNDAYISFLGSKHPQCLGRSGRDCWSEIWPVIGPMLEGVYATGEATWSEDLLLVLDRHLPREETYFTFSYSAIRDDDGTVRGIFCACNETTARVLGERRLKTLRDLNQIAEKARTAEAACEVAAQIMGENPGDVPYAIIYLLGAGAGEARLAAAAGVTPGSAAAPALIALRTRSECSRTWPLAEVLATGTARQVCDAAARFGSLPGGLWPESSSAARIVPVAAPGQSGPAGFLIAGLSPRRVLDDDYKDFLDLLAGHLGTAVANARAYEEERKRAEALAALDRAKTVFFSDISHEFRTPLTLMLGPLEEAAMSPATPAQVRGQIEIARRNSLRLLNLVNQLLDFSSIEAGRLQASYEPVELAALTRDLASNFRSAADRAGLELIVQCEPIGEPAYVDRGMWEKIVLNLLSNAFKYTLAGSIAVRLHREDAAVVLEVADTGVGIPAAALPRIFERFYRVEAASGRAREGSGIGLALVQELVRLHGGDIRVTSELGSGTTFRVRLLLGTEHLPTGRIKADGSPPATEISPEAFVDEALRWVTDEPSSSPQAFDADAGLRTSLRFSKAAGASILLADDNADMRAYLRELLSRQYRVEAVCDGRQALAAARSRRPDLILADIMMPQLDGLGLLKAVRDQAELRDVPFVLLSARAGEEARIEGLAAGADEYLVKPFAAGQLLARVGVLLELTHMRRESDAALRQSRAQLQTLIANSPYGVCLIDADLRVCEANPTACHTFGDVPDLVGRDFAELMRDLWPQEQAEEILAIFQRTLETGHPYRNSELVRRRLGREETQYYDWQAHRIPLSDGRYGVVCYFRDISRQVEARRVLELADQQKDEFLAMLAHELRNPLAPIGNASEFLSRVLREHTRAQSAIAMIKRQTAQLTRMVDDLLDVSRITRGRIQLRQRPIDLAGVISEALETVEPQFRLKRHKVSITTSYEPLFVNGDTARLVQCVVNLLNNAAKYTDAEGEIHIQTRAGDSTAVIEITDTGVGIPPELLPRVFDLFVQNERTLDRAQGGLGIGLSVTRRLIEMHGGRISAQSAGLGRGATFVVRLPRVARPEAVRAEPTPAMAVPRRVLIVDDNEDAANSLAMLLGFRGHDVRTAYSAMQALATLGSFEAEVALLDVGLPEMNGYQLAQRLRSDPNFRGTLLVAITGYGQADDRQRAFSAGFDDHLIKPVDLEALERALAAMPAEP